VNLRFASQHSRWGSVSAVVTHVVTVNIVFLKEVSHLLTTKYTVTIKCDFQWLQKHNKMTSIRFITTVLFISIINLAVAVGSEICTTEFRSPAVIENALDFKEKMNGIPSTSQLVKLYNEQTISTSFDFIDYL